jgi:hypothetical protein
MPVNLEEQAQDNLRFIRGAMERAGQASSVSGIGGMLMGFAALCAMVIAGQVGTLADQLVIWIAGAVLAVTIGAVSCWAKAHKDRLKLFGDPGRRFLLCLVPVLVVGAVLTASLWTTPQIALLPGFWMMLYGAGVLAAGTYAVAPVMQMGGCFLVAGLFTLVLPGGWSNLALGLAFGGLHIAFGFQVYRHHGG